MRIMETNSGERPLRPDQPELIFGIVRALGTDVDVVIDPLEAALEEANFHVEPVRISEQFRTLEPLREFLEEAPLDRRYESYMNAGDFLRASTQRPDACAILGVKRIRELRQRLTEEPDPTFRGRAFVIRHLMTRGEVETLRKIYGERLFVVGVFAPEEVREDRLAKKIANSKGVKKELARPDAMRLLNRDFGLIDPTDPLQQELIQRDKYRLNVRKTFDQSDLFLSVETPDTTRKMVRRFVQLIFSHPFHTPTKDEYGMALASLTALGSSDLSRRVGASIVTDGGQVLATGRNDAPKFRGGLYWPGDDPDHRDWKLGIDSSDEIRRELLEDVIRRLLRDSTWLTVEHSENDDDNTTEDEEDSTEKQIDEDLIEKLRRHLSTIDIDQAVSAAVESSHIRDSRVLDVTEYGRSVHAEMSALMDASRSGVSVKGASLYCTTFPCHQCARHIIAAGIRRVVYIEPYPKSRAGQLYDDEIGLVGKKTDIGDRVRFEPFAGIAPRQLRQIMGWVPRKKSDVPESDEELTGRIAEHTLSQGTVRTSILDEHAVLAGAVDESVGVMEQYFSDYFDTRVSEVLEEMSEAQTTEG